MFVGCWLLMLVVDVGCWMYGICCSLFLFVGSLLRVGCCACCWRLFVCCWLLAMIGGLRWLLSVDG